VLRGASRGQGLPRSAEWLVVAAGKQAGRTVAPAVLEQPETGRDGGPARTCLRPAASNRYPPLPNETRRAAIVKGPARPAPARG